MKLTSLKDIEKVVMKEVVRRRSLGGYNSEAESLLILSEVVLDIVRHLVDEYPEKEPAKEPAKKSSK